MAEEKRYPISDLKRAKLARSGVIPRSRELLTLGIVSGMAISFYLVSTSDLTTVINSLKESAADPSPSYDFIHLLITSLVLFLVPAYLSLLVISLVQTKFNFAPRALGFSVENFGSFNHIFKPKVTLGFWKIALLAIWCLGGYLLIQYAYTELFSYKSLGSVYEVEAFKSSGKKLILDSLFYIWLIGFLLAFFVGILSFFLARLAFDREHMMTRSEVEDEAREYESSEEVRQAQKELMG